MNWKSPYILLVVATCIWGGNFVAGKAIVAEMPPITVALCRWLIALICLLPWYGKPMWRARQQLKAHGKMILILSLTGVAGFNTLTYIAVQYTSSINAALMNSATPILIVLISWIMFRESMKWMAGIGIIVSMMGVCWIISRGSWNTISSLSFNAGDLWMIIAVLCWAFYSVGMKKVGSKFPPMVLLLAQIVISVGALIPASLIELIVLKPVIQVSFGLSAGLLYIGLFASIVAFYSWNRAIAELGPSRCAGFLNLIPMFSTLFATMFAGEHIYSYHLLGALLIISGVYVTNRILVQANSGTPALTIKPASDQSPLPK
jgi:drug/metabolite transporter (DMT)-like permease